MHDKYTWFFHGTPKGQTCAPVVLRTEAETEEAACAVFPGWDLDFAAKISTKTPIADTWTDADSMTLWSIRGTDVSCLLDMAGVRHA